MIETIRKIVSIEKAISRTNGVLPYIPYGEANESFVSPSDTNGNWGGFAMDIINESHSVVNENGFSVDKFNELDRVKYCDIIRRYNILNDILNEGVRTKCIIAETNIIYPYSYEVEDDDEDTSDEADDPTEDPLILTVEDGGRMVFGTTCSGYTVFDNTTSGLCLTARIADDEMPASRYDFSPVDSSYYIFDDNLYKHTEDVDDIVRGEFYMVTDRYDDMLSIEEWWVSGKTWCTELFGVDYDSFNTEYRDAYRFMKFVDDYIIGKVEVPLNISGVKVPEYVYYTNINTYKDWFERNMSVSGNTEWTDMGGWPFYDFLSNETEPKYITQIPSVGVNETAFTFSIPYITVPVFLDSEYGFDGFYESYMDGKTEFVPCPESGQTMWLSGETIMVESCLPYVIDENACVVNGIVGRWPTFEDGSNTSMFKCTYYSGESTTTGVSSYTITLSGESIENSVLINQTSAFTGEIPPVFTNKSDRIVIDSDEHFSDVIGDPVINSQDNTSAYTETISFWKEYRWWECERLPHSIASGLTCADDELVFSGESKYRTVTLLEQIKKMYRAPLCVGDYYYYMVKKDNGLVGRDSGRPIQDENMGHSLFEIPYVEGSMHNVFEIDDETVVCDYIKSIVKNADSGTCTIDYVIGAKMHSGETFEYIERTGIELSETFPYTAMDAMTATIDGVPDMTIYYESINTLTNRTVVYSDTYRMYRMANRASVVGMEVGTIFNSEDMFVAPIFTREYSSELTEDPKKSFNVMIDRGNAAAFEKHFKLSECDTFEDLKNYGNNFFNL